jgi:hypothetical protein
MNLLGPSFSPPLAGMPRPRPRVGGRRSRMQAHAARAGAAGEALHRPHLLGLAELDIVRAVTRTAAKRTSLPAMRHPRRVRHFAGGLGRGAAGHRRRFALSLQAPSAYRRSKPTGALSLQAHRGPRGALGGAAPWRRARAARCGRDDCRGDDWRVTGSGPRPGGGQRSGDSGTRRPAWPRTNLPTYRPPISPR